MQATAGVWHCLVIVIKFRVLVPTGGGKFVQTRAEDKLVWTMPSAAEFGETQKKHCVFFTGDKTMASVSLLCRLTLNSRLSIKKPAHEARVSVGNERCEASQKRRYCEGDRSFAPHIIV